MNYSCDLCTLPGQQWLAQPRRYRRPRSGSSLDLMQQQGHKAGRLWLCFEHLLSLSKDMSKAPGGYARAKLLTAEQRSASAQKAARARWDRRKKLLDPFYFPLDIAVILPVEESHAERNTSSLYRVQL